MSTSITKQGIIFADGESIGENLLLSTISISSSGTTCYLGGNSGTYYPLSSGTYTIKVNFNGRTTYPNIYYKIRDGSGVNLGNASIPRTFTLSESGDYRFWLYANPDNMPSIEENQILNFKLESGNVPTPWTPNPNDAIYTGEHGFFEGSDIVSIGKGYVSGREFYEM